MKDKMNYIEKDGIFYPDIKMPEQKEIGKWGLLHLGWLKHFRIARYNELLMSGELNEYLYRICNGVIAPSESNRTTAPTKILLMHSPR